MAEEENGPEKGAAFVAVESDQQVADQPAGSPKEKAQISDQDKPEGDTEVDAEVDAQDQDGNTADKKAGFVATDDSSQQDQQSEDAPESKDPDLTAEAGFTTLSEEESREQEERRRKQRARDEEERQRQAAQEQTYQSYLDFATTLNVMFGGDPSESLQNGNFLDPSPQRDKRWSDPANPLPMPLKFKAEVNGEPPHVKAEYDGSHYEFSRQESIVDMGHPYQRMSAEQAFLITSSARSNAHLRNQELRVKGNDYNQYLLYLFAKDKKIFGNKNTLNLLHESQIRTLPADVRKEAKAAYEEYVAQQQLAPSKTRKAELDNFGNAIAGRRPAIGQDLNRQRSVHQKRGPDIDPLAGSDEGGAPKSKPPPHSGGNAADNSGGADQEGAGPINEAVNGGSGQPEHKKGWSWESVTETLRNKVGPSVMAGAQRARNGFGKAKADFKEWRNRPKVDILSDKEAAAMGFGSARKATKGGKAPGEGIVLDEDGNILEDPNAPDTQIVSATPMPREDFDGVADVIVTPSEQDLLGIDVSSDTEQETGLSVPQERSQKLLGVSGVSDDSGSDESGAASGDVDVEIADSYADEVEGTKAKDAPDVIYLGPSKKEAASDFGSSAAGESEVAADSGLDTEKPENDKDDQVAVWKPSGPGGTGASS